MFVVYSPEEDLSSSLQEEVSVWGVLIWQTWENEAATGSVCKHLSLLIDIDRGELCLASEPHHEEDFTSTLLKFYVVLESSFFMIFTCDY